MKTKRESKKITVNNKNVTGKKLSSFLHKNRLHELITEQCNKSTFLNFVY